MLKESNLENLTKSQVEALLECFDFLANGYQEAYTIEVGDLWVIQLRHMRTMKRVRVFIRPTRYRILINGNHVKIVTRDDNGSRYRIIVNSDASVGVIRTRSGAN